MNIRNSVYLLLAMSFTASADDAAIAAVIDDFHDAAAHGDNARYLGHMTDDAVFMGTDEWERWPKQPDFVDYVGGRFKDGIGWTYRSVQRNIRLADAGNIAWFDEVIFSETSGRFRGTGVVVLENGTWKIAHYAMSFLVFNENWEDVIELSKQTSAMKKNTETDQ
ncbi:MAG: nuclear transport factor 2 family protein [Gammaproteobacteria bacterium]|jgi:ketosteroid isomerase-like protein|nr:nuclear transport factor 2 family protein [Gammaproteobacteria bacterium]